ncbi:hypothetical protein [Leptospira licerasiae]|uniref:hypothetical protein n=1 Tax=Leptospira licerasiae TaxID=447106 RepID=UPI001082A3D9|nr:hypothetical protein [Leptospira licerasiae]TGM85567.1 hypothetical protein EHR05_19445 [Leptospira licerasiae]
MPLYENNAGKEIPVDIDNALRWFSYGDATFKELNGAIPDKLRFSTQIKDAVAMRVQENRKINCSEC